MDSVRPRTMIEEINDKCTPTWFETYKTAVRIRDDRMVGTLAVSCALVER